MTEIRVKRIYAPPTADDGLRILVDRIWPRGVSKTRAAIDAWWKDLAPTTELRKQFSHAPALWDAFRVRYFQQLDEMDLAETMAMIKDRRATLLFATKEERYNNAVALREYLLRKMG